MARKAEEDCSCEASSPACTNVGKALSSSPLHRDDRAGPASRMRGAPNFAAAFVSLPLHSSHDKIGTPTPLLARPLRGPVTPTPPDRQPEPVLNEQTEVHMHTQTARTQAWLADLASIQS
jgi:hypothetical protein